MQPRSSLILTLACAALIAGPATVRGEDESARAAALARGGAAHKSIFREAAGVVYAMSNATSENRILLNLRLHSGRLYPFGSVSTGGRGTGTSLGNQNALIVDSEGRWLLAVNAASDDVSVFRIQEFGLELVSRTPSGGRRPISVTTDRGRVWVLNAGGAVGDVDNITGFTLENDGTLVAIAGAMAPLSGPSTAPAQIQFSPNGQHLLVTEKATNVIDVFQLGPDGLILGSQVFPSASTTPFGFAFGKRGQVFVSEAAQGAADGGSVTTYRLSASGDLAIVDASVATTETAACWVVVTNDGRFAYVTNTGSESISGFDVDFDGNLNLLNAGGKSGRTGNGTTPIDLVLSPDDDYLYALDNGTGSISVFRVLPSGGLVRLQILRGLPAGANGIAAR